MVGRPLIVGRLVTPSASSGCLSTGPFAALRLAAGRREPAVQDGGPAPSPPPCAIGTTVGAAGSAPRRGHRGGPGRRRPRHGAATLRLRGGDGRRRGGGAGGGAPSASCS